MMKQKDHDIVDVRGPVPDCPEWMSRLIQSMTRRSPELRPGSSTELLKTWRTSSGNSLSHCRAFAQVPDHSLRKNLRPKVRAGRGGTSWLWPTAAASALAILVFLAAQSGVVPHTLRLSSSSDVASEAQEIRTQKLPKPQTTAGREHYRRSMRME